jgi:hypothetical protein
MQTISERIELLIDALDLNINSFSKALGYPNNNVTIGRIVNDKSKKPSLETTEKILRTFPQVNPTWLVIGDGPMFIEGENHNTVPYKKPSDATTAPLISQYAYAGYLAGFADPDFLECQPQFTASKKHNGGHYIAFEIKGDSMDDGTRRSICEGDIVLARELQKLHWQNKLHIPKVFIIVHKTDGIICKEIVKHDVKSGVITCHSWNPDPDYEDFELNLHDVMQLFYVKEISRQNKY